MSSVVVDGALPVAALVAAAAGVVSFASPCVLPLVPGFLGYVTGLSSTPIGARRRSRLVAGTALFVLGFTAVFVPVTVAVATSLSLVLREHQGGLLRAAGVVVMLLALVFAGLGSQRSAKLTARPAAGMAGAPLLGAAFALGWTPCIGPTLAAVIAIANPLGEVTTATLARGVVLGIAYCLGLGVPFLAMAAAYSRLSGAWGWLRRHQRAVQLAGAAALFALGALMAAGVWEQLMVTVQARLTAGFETVL